MTTYSYNGHEYRIQIHRPLKLTPRISQALTGLMSDDWELSTKNPGDGGMVATGHRDFVDSSEASGLGGVGSGSTSPNGRSPR